MSQSHWACDQVTTYLRPKHAYSNRGQIVKRTHNWSQRSWVIAKAKLVAASSMVVFKTSKATHSGLDDFWIVRLVAIGPRCDRSTIFATISSSGRIPRSISTRAWSRYHERLENIDGKSHRRKSCDYSI